MSELVSRPLTVLDEPVAREAHAELAAEGFELLLDLREDEPWATCVDRWELLRRGIDVPADRVPATFLVAEVAGELAGRTSVRHTLNPYLARVGGHVGYAVRPHARRRGRATEILRRSLDLLRRLGVTRALTTCDDDNVGSATVIQRCDGSCRTSWTTTVFSSAGTWSNSAGCDRDVARPAIVAEVSGT